MQLEAFCERTGCEGPASVHDHPVVCDPLALDWSAVELPDAWPDSLNWWSPLNWPPLLRSVLGRPARAIVPDGLPGRSWIPKYLLQEFHRLPNGNYSKRVTRGYITGFDYFMLGEMRRARERIAQDMQSCERVLDVGCGGGQTAQLLVDSGAREVWGIDPSPYLLQHAARSFPSVKFVQGLAEDLRFPVARFDGVVACFLLHELPPRVAVRALREFHRVLKPGGKLALCEPSPEQLRQSSWPLLKHYGWRGAYFRLLAKVMHEPFVTAWHRQDAVDWLKRIGFAVIEDRIGMPTRYLLAEKLDTRDGVA